MAGAKEMAASTTGINATSCPRSCEQAVGGDTIGFITQKIHR
jgi:hypothetical protein